MAGMQWELYLQGEVRAEGVYVEVARAARVEEAADTVATEVAATVADGVVD